MANMTVEELQTIAYDFLDVNYGIPLSIPIERNNRLKRKMGRFTVWVCEDCDEIPYSIEIAGFMFEYAADEVVIDTVLHECVHYALFQMGLPYEDGSPTFETELKRHGIGATETNYVGVIYTVKCADCGKVGESCRKPNANRYVSQCCEAPIEYLGEVIYDGTEAIA